MTPHPVIVVLKACEVAEVKEQKASLIRLQVALVFSLLEVEFP